MWDLIVVGLGPAGSTAARRAALRGLKVLGLDRARFPRSKVCAAGLTGRAIRHLPLKSDCYREAAINRVHIHWDGRDPLTVESSSGLMVTTRRETLDNALLELAGQAGVEIREGCHVSGVNTGSRSTGVYCSRGTEFARYVIGCDGANSVLGRSVRMKRPAFYPAWQVEYAIPETADDHLRSDVRFHLGAAPHGYGWIFPKKTSVVVGVAGRFGDRRTLETAMQRVTKLLPAESGWRRLTAGGHSIPVFDKRNSIASGGLLLAGDAAGLVDPFLGEGIYYALRSGEIAGDWVAGELAETAPERPDYPTLIRNELGPDLSIAGRLGKIVYSMPCFMQWLARRHPGIFQRLAQNLSNESGYTGFAQTLPFLWRHLIVDRKSGNDGSGPGGATGGPVSE